MNRSKYIRLYISPTQAAKYDLQMNQIIKAVHLISLSQNQGWQMNIYDSGNHIN